MDLMVMTYTPANKEGRIALAQSMSSYWAAMVYGDIFGADDFYRENCSGQ